MSAQRAMNPRARAWIAELDLAGFRMLADDPEAKAVLERADRDLLRLI